MQKKHTHTKLYTRLHNNSNKMSLMLTARYELRKCLTEEMIEGERNVERERENTIGEKFR